MADLTDAVHALVGMRLVEIRRVLNIAIVIFRHGDGTEHTIHAQCPFRVLHGEAILLGSFDMHWPRRCDADRDEAFDTFATMYDGQAKLLTSIFADGEFRVTRSELETAGALGVEAANGPHVLRLEAIPMTSGPTVESWRLFRLGDSVHHVYPAAADRD